MFTGDKTISGGSDLGGLPTAEAVTWVGGIAWLMGREFRGPLEALQLLSVRGVSY